MRIFTDDDYAMFDKKSVNIENVLMFLIGTISSMAIYASDTTLSTKTTQMALVAFVYVAILIVGYRVVSKNFIRLSPLLISPIIYVLICYFDSSEPKFNMLLLLDLLLFVSLSDDSKTFIYILFRKYMVLTGFLGAIAFVAFTFSLPLPYDVVAYYSEFSTSVYLNYHFSYLVASAPFVRLCGFFNEPGYYGTIAAFVLCIERLNLKQRGNIILFVAGILTFSVAFYVIVSAYAILMARKNKVVFVCLIGLFIFVFLIVPDINMGASFDRIIERLSFSDGKLSGDNRSKDTIDDLVVNMIGSPQMQWGYGKGYASSIESQISTYKTYIIDYGYCGFLLMYGSLVLTTFKYAKRNIYVMLFLLCFYLSIYQRPNVFTLTYFFILLGGIAYINKQTELSQNRIQ